MRYISSLQVDLSNALPRSTYDSNTRGTDPAAPIGPRPIEPRAETDQEHTRSVSDTPGSTAASYGCCPARCTTRQLSLHHQDTHPSYTIARATNRGLQRYPTSHQRAYAARTHHRPLHRRARTPSIPDAKLTSHYVAHHLDVCTVTALNDKQAFSDSIANRGRELSRGPNIATAPSPPMPSTQEWHHAPREGPTRSRPSLSNPLCLCFSSCSEERPQLQDGSCQFWISGTATDATPRATQHSTQRRGARERTAILRTRGRVALLLRNALFSELTRQRPQPACSRSTAAPSISLLSSHGRYIGRARSFSRASRRVRVACQLREKRATNIRGLCASRV